MLSLDDDNGMNTESHLNHARSALLQALSLITADGDGEEYEVGVVVLEGSMWGLLVECGRLDGVVVGGCSCGAGCWWGGLCLLVVSGGVIVEVGFYGCKRIMIFLG